VKCPKCGYLGFEQVDRCRNCGYEFTLAAVAVPDLSLSKRTSDGPATEDLGFVGEKSAAAPSAASSDLPLFGSAAAVDEALILKPSPPRQPLAVRRTSPDTPRLRVEPRAQTFDLAFEPESSPLRSPVDEASQAVASRVKPGLRTATADAGLVSRLFAAVIDLCILAAVDVLVVYLTVQICGISLHDAWVLPKGPLLAFLLAQNVGYLVIFTAGGQTLGKVAAGIKVVTADASGPLDLGQSAIRTLVWFALAVPAGLGFLTAFLTPDHRGLHDRFAGTRVVRASV
jgi:uncharacterized RDD family membrane protein YckC